MLRSGSLSINTVEELYRYIIVGFAGFYHLPITFGGKQHQISRGDDYNKFNYNKFFMILFLVTIWGIIDKPCSWLPS